MAIAFFDLDRTLIAHNSGLQYAQFERREGRITRTQLVRATLWTLGYHLSVIDMQRAYEAALAHYRGTPAHEIEARTRRWFEHEVRPRLLRQALDALRWHRDRGDRLVLLSNTSNFQATVATERWGFDDWIANHLLCDDTGALTGSLEAPMCHGEGKVVRAHAWLDAHDARDEETWFYTDSYSDVPGLHAVDHPIVVHPDPRLARYAARQGWAVHDWRPGGEASEAELDAWLTGR
jgi:HAD superfamily hydrolase (TIGR01490 family)